MDYCGRLENKGIVRKSKGKQSCKINDNKLFHAELSTSFLTAKGVSVFIYSWKLS